MSDLISPEAALRLVPGWKSEEASVETLAGGLTNRTFRVSYQGQIFVLRLDSVYSRAFEFDRVLEREIMQRAHAAGLGPRVIFADDDVGMMLREHVDGRAWATMDMQSDKNLERLAELLREVHALPLSGRSIDLPEAASAYAENLEENTELQPFASRCAEIVSATPISAAVVCGHNDIVAGNVIQSDRLMLIDWEYACDSDPMYDLASAVAYHDLGRSAATTLLHAYTGSASAAWQERLDEQVRTFDAIQWLWLANRQLIAPISGQWDRLDVLRKRIQ